MAIAAISGGFLWASVNRELDSLTHEEVDEMTALFAAASHSRAEFDRFAAELQASHPANRLAWRVWSPDGSLWHESGPPEMLAAADPRPEPIDSNQAVRPSLRWRTEALEDGRRVAVVLDGSAQHALLSRYEAFSLALLIGATLCAGWIASLLSRRTSALLHVVADAARSGDADFETARGVALPEEIRAVADSLSATLTRIRSEQERAKLMTSGLAHELRSPIQNLLGEAEVALMRERSTAEYQEVLEAQIEELHELGRSVDNLVLLCSRDQRPDRAETFDLGDEATLRLDRDSLRASRSGVRIELELYGDLTVRGDR
jgi:two-component system heavy metal sensor histidine kinase CusS